MKAKNSTNYPDRVLEMYKTMTLIRAFEEIAEEAFRLCSHKLPIKTKMVPRRDFS